MGKIGKHEVIWKGLLERNGKNVHLIVPQDNCIGKTLKQTNVAYLHGLVLKDNWLLCIYYLLDTSANLSFTRDSLLQIDIRKGEFLTSSWPVLLLMLLAACFDDFSRLPWIHKCLNNEHTRQLISFMAVLFMVVEPLFHVMFDTLRGERTHETFSTSLRIFKGQKRHNEFNQR